MKLKKLTVLSASLAALFFVSPSLSEPQASRTANTLVSSQILNTNTDKTIIKAVEPVILLSGNGNAMVKARIDTGATQSSIDMKLAKQIGFDKHIGMVNVVSANGIKSRPVIEVSYQLSGKMIKSRFTIADRRNLHFPVLIGREDLKGFLVDPIDN